MIHLQIIDCLLKQDIAQELQADVKNFSEQLRSILQLQTRQLILIPFTVLLSPHIFEVSAIVTSYENKKCEF